MHAGYNEIPRLLWFFLQSSFEVNILNRKRDEKKRVLLFLLEMLPTLCVLLYRVLFIY